MPSMFSGWTLGRLKSVLAVVIVIVLLVTGFLVLHGGMVWPSVLNQYVYHPSDSVEENEDKVKDPVRDSPSLVDPQPSHPHPSLAPVTDWLAEQKRRKQQVREVCQKSGKARQMNSQRMFDPGIFKNILVDNKHKVLFCSVPKVACSSWKTTMTLLTGKVQGTGSPLSLDVHEASFLETVGLRYLNRYPPAKIKDYLTNYQKFFFVRDPLERLLSAYRDKFTKHNAWTNYFQRRYGTRMVKRFRKNPSQDSLKRGHDVQFKEFVRFLLDSSIKDRERFNPHWEKYHVQCHPCIIHYDVIGKYETMQDDNEKILQILFNQTDLSEFNFPKRNVKGVPTKVLMTDFYGNLTKSLVQNLEKMYKWDYRLFGYSEISDSLPFRSNEPGNATSH